MRDRILDLRDGFLGPVLLAAFMVGLLLSESASCQHEPDRRPATAARAAR